MSNFDLSHTTVIEPRTLYKWANVWGGIQKKYYQEKIIIRREKQIIDFLVLNEFNRPFFIKDTDIFNTIPDQLNVSNSIEDADIVVVTDQKFSRAPCPGIVEDIKTLLKKCNRLYICLNRHYINIDNSYCDSTLSENFNLAVTQWLKKELGKGIKILDLSLDYLDHGDYFTWVIPDRQYYIEM